MTNPFDEDIELEGFLCPMCKADLKTPDNLTSHFEKEHSESEDQYLLKLKDIFITARKKITFFDDGIDLSQTIDNTVKSAFAAMPSKTPEKQSVTQTEEPQSIGMYYDRILEYKANRWVVCIFILTDYLSGISTKEQASRTVCIGNE